VTKFQSGQQRPVVKGRFGVAYTESLIEHERMPLQRPLGRRSRWQICLAGSFRLVLRGRAEEDRSAADRGVRRGTRSAVRAAASWGRIRMTHRQAVRCRGVSSCRDCARRLPESMVNSCCREAATIKACCPTTPL